MNQDRSTLRILVIEDDPRMLELLCRGLREFGHTVMPAADGIAGLDLALSVDFDLVLLDIGLPFRNGYEVTQSLRVQQKSVKILMLTARDAEDDIILGLDTGADGYLIKPFSFPELVARIHSLTRPLAEGVNKGGLVLDQARMTVTRGNVSVQLSRTEFALLAALNANTGKCASRELLTAAIWNGLGSISANQLDVLVNALRNKLDAPFCCRMVETIRGVGYRLCVDESSCTERYSSLQPQSEVLMRNLSA